MKLHLPLVLLMLTGCSTIQSPSTVQYQAKTELNVEAGYYTQLQFSNWKKGNSVCLEVTIDKPYGGTKWAPSTMLYIDDGNDNHRLMLSLSEGSTLGSLHFNYSLIEGSKKVSKKILANGFKYGQPLQYEVFFSQENQVSIKSKHFDATIPLEFSPKAISFAASSSVSTVKLLKNSECK
jgi:hypothetical protein